MAANYSLEQVLKRAKQNGCRNRELIWALNLTLLGGSDAMAIDLYEDVILSDQFDKAYWIGRATQSTNDKVV